MRCLHQCDVPVTGKGTPHKVFANAATAFAARGDGSDPTTPPSSALAGEKVISRRSSRVTIPEDIAERLASSPSGPRRTRSRSSSRGTRPWVLPKCSRAEDGLRTEWGLPLPGLLQGARARAREEKPEVWRQPLVTWTPSSHLLDEFQDTSAQQWRSAPRRRSSRTAARNRASSAWGRQAVHLRVAWGEPRLPRGCTSGTPASRRRRCWRSTAPPG